MWGWSELLGACRAADVSRRQRRGSVRVSVAWLERCRTTLRCAPMLDSQPTAEPYEVHARAAGLSYVSDTEPGIRRCVKGRGFSYYATGGRRISDQGTLQRIRSLAVPPAWTEVWIC